MPKRDNSSGPYIRWDNYGYEGWKPSSYDTLNEALSDQRFVGQACVTKLVLYKIEDVTPNA